MVCLVRDWVIVTPLLQRFHSTDVLKGWHVLVNNAQIACRFTAVNDNLLLEFQFNPLYQTGQSVISSGQSAVRSGVDNGSIVAEREIGNVRALAPCDLLPSSLQGLDRICSSRRLVVSIPELRASSQARGTPSTGHLLLSLLDHSRARFVTSIHHTSHTTTTRSHTSSFIIPPSKTRTMRTPLLVSA